MGFRTNLFNSKTFKGNFRKQRLSFPFYSGDPGGIRRLGKKLPELGMEFKRYFSMPTAEIYHRIEMSHTQRRFVSLQSPYR